MRNDAMRLKLSLSQHNLLNDISNVEFKRIVNDAIAVVERLARLEDEMSDLVSMREHQDALIKVEKLELLVNDLNEELSSVKRQAQGLSNSSNEEIQRLVEENKRILKEFSGVQEALQKAKQQVQGIRDVLKENALDGDKDKDKEEVLSLVKALVKDLKEKEKLAKGQKERIDLLTQANKELLLDAEDMKGKLDSLANENERVKISVQEMSSQALQKLTESLRLMEKDLLSLRNEREGFERENKRLKEEVKELLLKEERIASLVKENNNLKKDCGDLTTQRDILKTKFEDSRKVIRFCCFLLIVVVVVVVGV
jgi:chromosome segregation ATPase